MALEGNLTAFGVSEILQLIAVQQKTGMLTISNVDATTVMFFRNGEIVSARDRRRKARDAFRDYVTRYGVLERDQLVRISQISSQSKLDFTDILTSEGFLDPQDLLKHWRQQIQESMHDVLTWEEGTYKFISSGELVDGLKSLGSFNVEGMLMESMRRIDEFPLMLEMFPSEKLLFQRSGTEPEVSEMTENEQRIYSLLQAPIPLVDVIAAGKMPVFEVYEAFKSLREKELVLVEEPEVDEDEVAAQAEASSSRKRSFKNVKPFIAALLLFSGAAYLGLGSAVAEFKPGSLTGSVGSFLSSSLASPTILSGEEIGRTRMEHQLRWLIEAHRARHGVYPSSLDELRSTGFATEAFLERARAHEFRYQLTADRAAYTLL